MEWRLTENGKIFRRFLTSCIFRSDREFPSSSRLFCRKIAFEKIPGKFRRTWSRFPCWLCYRIQSTRLWRCSHRDKFFIHASVLSVLPTNGKLKQYWDWIIFLSSFDPSHPSLFACSSTWWANEYFRLYLLSYHRASQRNLLI